MIYGASSSVGAYAVQLAKRAGLFVVAIAGASGDYVKSLGADVVIDYRKHKGKEAMVICILRLLDQTMDSHYYLVCSLLSRRKRYTSR